MDSKSHLDRALFRLTPTRTRFDLVLFYKGKNEKLASGLFEPFISHLKVARDEITKGGYSICLQPPVLNVPWFTKATLERFVRFVSTPAVLERFVCLEKEILQIEKSVQDNEVSKTNLVGKQEEVHEPVANLTRRSSDSSELKGELCRKDAKLPEENSKIQLQRLLETRKTLLRKEQAMAYARGLVAGFAMENMDDLICFAEAFGASRLREACVNFIELCKKKHADQLWMEELAAVKACSPVEFSALGASSIVLTNENSSPNPDSNESPDSKKAENSPASIPAGYPMQMQWPNQIPPYMYNFPGYAQQMPSYQGYPFPPMQPNPHYPRNGHQPRKQKSSSRKKEKLLNGEEDEYSGEEGQTESSATDSGCDSGSRTNRQDRNHSSPDRSSRRKHKKKSSRTIVIRNINYITPKKRDGEKGQVSDGSSSDEEEYSGKDSSLNSRSGKSRGSEKISDDNLEAVVSREGKIDNNWEAFQNILSNENASTKWVETDALTPALDMESRKVLKQRMVAADSFVVKGRDDKTDSRMKFDEFGNEESYGALRTSSNCADEVLFNSRRLEESGNGFGDILAMSAEGSSIIKSGKGEDWFVANHSGKLENQDSTNGKITFDGDQVLSFEGDHSYPQKSKRESFIDDSIMVQSRPELDGQYDSQWKTEISIMEDLSSASKQENGTADINQDQKTVYDSHEPDDLFMVIGRDEGLESARDSMNFDYEIDLSLTEVNRRCSDVDAENKVQDGEKTPVKTNGSSGTKKPGKEARSNVLRGSLNSRPGTLSRSQKTSPLVSKAKSHKSKFEQEEEIRKKMEELAIERQKRIAERTAAAKKPTSETKTAKNSIKLDKSKSLPAARATGRVSTVKF